MRNIVCENSVSGKATRLTVAFPNGVERPHAQRWLDQYLPGYQIVSVAETPAPQIICDERNGEAGGLGPSVPQVATIEGPVDGTPNVAVQSGASNPFDGSSDMDDGDEAGLEM